MEKTKKQKTDAFPIPEPLSVDYAPTGRAACKKCQSAIGEGSVRVGRLVRSRFHDGFDTQLYHWRCGNDFGTSLDEFKGWQSQLRWGGPNDDVERLMKNFGEEFIDDEKIVAEYKQRNQWLQTASLHIADAPVALLRQVFEANDMVFSDRLKGIDLARVLADQIFFGKLPPCPTCNTNGLRQSGTDIRCSGWFSASTKCEFKFRLVNLIKNRPLDFGGISVGDELMKSRLARNSNLVIPEDVAQHKAFKTLMIPKEVQQMRKKLNVGSGAGGSKGGGLASSVMASLDSEDEDISTVDKSQWLLGMKFVLCGIEDYDVFAKKIEKFGGQVFEDVVIAGPDRTTHLVISEEELFKDPKSAKYRKCNDAGIPIVKEEFVLAATDESGTDSFVAERSGSKLDKNQPPEIVEVSGRSKKRPNAIINGKYRLLVEETIADRPVYKKEKDEKCPELFIYFSQSRGKWKIAPSTNDGKGHVAINNDTKAERPDLCAEKNWEIFDGKDKGFSCDDEVAVKAKESKKRKNVPQDEIVKPAGLFLRQRKFLKTFIVEGSVGKRLPTIKECLIAQAGLATKGRKKRPSPKPGSPIVTVDEEVAGEYRDAAIFVDPQNNVYNVLLTKTDAATNVNKFYAIQLIAYSPKKSSSSAVRGGSQNFAVFRKWGRFGYTGSGPMNGSMSVDFGPDKSAAIEAFREKFSECTGLDFDVRDIAPQKPGRYAFVELQGQDGEAGGATKKSKAKKISGSTTPSELPTEITELIELIFDLEMIEREMSKSMDIDTSRLPPNALSKRQLGQGLGVLREIEKILSPQLEETGDGDFEVGKENIDGPTRELKLRDCSNRFYTIVPHCFDRKQVVPIIETVRVLKKLIRNIEDLMQIVELEEIRSSSIAHQASNQRPLTDVQYEELGCKIEVVGKSTSEYELIAKAVAETHAATHSTYSMKIDKIFKVERPGEVEAFENDPCRDNRKMLWHGSRLSNWASILKNGLRIAPKEAPVSGYMFGKGLYFADSSSKSANYCFATEEEPDGLLVLCDVALGKQYLRLEAQYEAPNKSRKKGCDSTWGVGQSAPLQSEPFPGGSSIACGPVEENTEALEQAKAEWPRGKPSLLYNEYIVYRESQVQMKYIVHVNFDFKK